MTSAYLKISVCEFSGIYIRKMNLNSRNKFNVVEGDIRL